MTTQGLSRGRRVRIWNRIPFQLGSSVLLLSWIALALGFLLFSRQQEQQFAQQHIRQAKKESAVIAAELAQHMLAGGGRAVWNSISSAAVQYRDLSGASNIFVLSGSGSIKSASDASAIDTRIDLINNPRCPRCDSERPADFPALATLTASDGARSLRVVNAVPISQPCLRCHDEKNPPRSFVVTDFDMAQLDRDNAQRREQLLIAALLAGVLVMALTTTLFRMLVMRPVHAITRSAAYLAAGNLSGRARVMGRNELALLALDFNHMAERIEQQVLRIESDKTESGLLYTLVVEASKNLETNEVASSFARVIRERLLPQHAAFFLESSDGGWICAASDAIGRDSLARGEGVLEQALAAGGQQLRQLLADTPAQLVANACSTLKLQLLRDVRGLSFALPVLADTRFVGLLICFAIPAAIRVGADMLENLGVHLALAAINSRNYTGAITDGLTRLKNKRYGLMRLDEAMYAAKRYRSGLGLLMCDIDHFKQVNDGYGHPAGDAVLKEVSRRIAACLRKADIAVRFGGEEFMLILPASSADGLVEVGEKIRQAVCAVPIDLGAAGISLALSISVGVAAFIADSDSADSLIARADAALYRAKEGGRNRVEVSG